MIKLSGRKNEKKKRKEKNMEIIRSVLLVLDVMLIPFVIAHILSIIANADETHYFCITVSKKGSEKKAETVYIKTDSSEAKEATATEIVRLLEKNGLTPDTAAVDVRETSEEEYKNSLSKR